MDLRPLLEANDSPLARVARHALVGLRATLVSALADARNDAGRAACEAFIAELDLQLGLQLGSAAGPATARTSPIEMPSSARMDAAPVPDEGPRFRAGLLESVAELVPLDRIRGRTTSALWRLAHVLSLRLGPAEARALREKLSQLARSAGATPDEAVEDALPFIGDVTLCPSLSGAVEARGFNLRAAAPGHAGLLDVDVSLEPFVRAASSALALMELDPSVSHAIEGLYRFGIAPMGQALDAVGDELIHRLKLASRAEGADRLRALVLVDEALHALLHEPLAAPGSAWSALAETSRAALFRAGRAQPGVELREMPEDYPSVVKAQLTKNDIAGPQLGRRGRVLVTLRVHASIGGQILPGRVIYA